MALQAGQLLISRQRLTLADGITSVDTGLSQVNLGVTPPLDGQNVTATTAAIASRVQVQPLAPTAAWTTGNIHHDEPYLDPTTNTVWVDFWVETGTGPQTINVLFWDPHSMISPMTADAYIPSLACNPPLEVNGRGGTNNGAAGNPFSVNNPATANGQLILAVFSLHTFAGNWAAAASDPTLTDAGWTIFTTNSLDLGGGNGLKTVVAYRVSAPGDPATYAGSTAGASAGWLGCALMFAFTPFDATTPTEALSATVGTAVAVDPLSLSTPSITVSNNSTVFYVGVVSNSYAGVQTYPAGFTGTSGQSAGTGPRTAGTNLTVAWTQGVSGVVPAGTFTWDDTFNLSTRAGYVFAFGLSPVCGLFPDGTSP